LERGCFGYDPFLIDPQKWYSELILSKDSAIIGYELFFILWFSMLFTEVSNTVLSAENQ